ncbi:hypothetical protein FLJC2902T_25960 [Flavobacterium limnosediminis JC2902]|uniref:Uncharacterized protein n=1 Tax=Flavobacterium limnosediminis JC2902 TaxID=1341181 RepID=V6SK04_9FLAO|nr:hypothetical protein [Flavobacterium limnosediminis]ESU26622.1 hypothetical protein FLJC2902T_25960 [Flavobacterium limnosediminis JC2902]
MKKLYFLLTLTGLTTTLFSQSKMNGKLVDESALIPNVEVINATKQLIVKTNDEGDFQILADINDEIIIYSKNYLEKHLKVKKEHLTNENIIVLQRKQIDLEELKIEKLSTFKVDMSYDALKMEKIYKEQSRPKPEGVYTGEIQNGADFVAIGGKLVGLVRKLFPKKEKKEASERTESFSTMAKNRFTYDFFTRNLNLNENEIDLFLTFCEMDEASKTFNKKSGALDLMDFLLKKRGEFK